MRLVLATSNPYKLAEVREILGPAGYEIVGLDAYPQRFEEPSEDGETFEANALIKARSYAAQLAQWCVAEDSGLEVDALNGLPGVHSARFAGETGGRDERDARNNRKLLELLRGVPPEQRRARFVCVMCVATPDGKLIATARGTYEGRIADAPRGSNGFGYDPLLWLPDVGKTSAELSSQEKHARSHRGHAARELVERLREWQFAAGGQPA